MYIWFSAYLNAIYLHHIVYNRYFQIGDTMHREQWNHIYESFKDLIHKVILTIHHHK